MNSINNAKNNSVEVTVNSDRRTITQVSSIGIDKIAVGFLVMNGDSLVKELSLEKYIKDREKR
jgi:hypothetical protein